MSRGCPTGRVSQCTPRGYSTTFKVSAYPGPVQHLLHSPQSTHLPFAGPCRYSDGWKQVKTLARSTSIALISQDRRNSRERSAKAWHNVESTWRGSIVLDAHSPTCAKFHPQTLMTSLLPLTTAWIRSGLRLMPAQTTSAAKTPSSNWLTLKKVRPLHRSDGPQVDVPAVITGIASKRR